MTPNIERIWDRVHANWPGVGSMGIKNCRHIGSDPTRSWSQHAASNGWDITSPYRPKWRTNPVHMRYLDRIYDFLEANRDALGIRTILWRTTNHYDHIHVDCWPKLKDNPTYIPPCEGGQLVVMYPDGAAGTEFVLYPGDVMAIYRTVINVPHHSNGDPYQWAKDVIDWGIDDAKIINIDDNFPEDWDRTMTDGRLWTFLKRYEDAQSHGLGIT